MAKLTLTDLTQGFSTSTVARLNANNAAIEDALEKTLSRDGTSPNEMEADLDMNSNQILNLPQAVEDTEPVRKLEFDVGVDSAAQAAIDAAAAAEQALIILEAVTGFSSPSIGLPVSNGDISNKEYADLVTGGNNFREPVAAATTTVLASSSYSAATASTRAKITFAANGALAAIDGITLVTGDRLLVKDEVLAAKNDVYIVAQGTASTPTILTKAAELDVNTHGEIFYVIGGSVNGGKLFLRSDGSNIYTDTALSMYSDDFITTGQLDALSSTVASNTTSIANSATISSIHTFSAPSLYDAQISSISKYAQTTILTGYYANGDTPKAYYKRVTSQPSHPGRFRSIDRYLPNGNIDNSNGGWWELNESVVDLRMLGAVCDGAHPVEDTLAWSNASAMHNADKLFHLMIPPNSTVSINQGVFTRVSGTKDLVIEGYGSSSIVKATNNASLNSILETDPGAGGLTLLNFVIDGNRSNTGMAHPVSTGGIVCYSDNLKLLGMEFKEFAFAGVVLFSNIGDPLVNNVLVKDCYFHDIGCPTDESGGGNPFANAGTSIFGGADNVTLLNNRFIDIHGLIEPIGDSNAFNVSGDNHIGIGNYCRDCHNGRGGMFGMGASGSKKITLIGNVVEQTVYFASERSNGIAVETDAGGYWVVADNVIKGTAGSGISTGTTSRGFSITNNVIMDWGGGGETNCYALYANQDVTFGKITGNVFSQLLGSGIYGILVNTTGGNILVSNNIFDANIAIPNTMNFTPSAITLPDNLNFNNTMHVADLPNAAANPGLRICVNDCNTSVFHAIAAGGGSDIVGVVAGNGVWRVG